MGDSEGRARADTRPLVWIVDDSPTQAAFTEHSLGATYEYERFLDGETAIERLTSTTTRPDLILLDWVMPGLSGDEVCRYVRGLPEGRDVAIVIVTASRTDTGDIVCSLESGANDYVAKPFAPAELRARISSLLRASELNRQASLERRRLEAMNGLANALLVARSDIQRVVEAVAAWMVSHVADGCGVMVKSEASTYVASNHRTSVGSRQMASFASSAAGYAAFADRDESSSGLGALQRLADAYGVQKVVVRRFEIGELGTWTAALVRGEQTPPFDTADILVIETALEYSRLAVETALRSQRDRSTARFHQEMLGIVSHDLRTPLTAFELGVELLASDKLTRDETAVLRSRLDRTTKRMSAIVEQLLDVTRSQIGGGIAVALSRMSLRALVERVVDELHMASATQSRFEIEGLDIEGVWDASRLEQVIANLASNAAQYGRSGTPIRISLASSLGRALITVHNQNRGEPIPAATLVTLFDPFRRGPTSGNVGGLGLGLYISFEIVKAHGGTIVVASDENGTSFQVSLPWEQT